MKAPDLQHGGDLYLPSDPDIAKAQLAAQELQYDFNQTRPSEGKKRQELLQKMFAEAGLKPGQKVVTYCNTGMQASHAYFTLRYLGYDVSMYDASFSEWSKAEGTAVVSGKK